MNNGAAFLLIMVGLDGATIRSVIGSDTLYTIVYVVALVLFAASGYMIYRLLARAKSRTRTQFVDLLPGTDIIAGSSYVLSFGSLGACCRMFYVGLFRFSSQEIRVCRSGKIDLRCNNRNVRYVKVQVKVYLFVEEKMMRLGLTQINLVRLSAFIIFVPCSYEFLCQNRSCSAARTCGRVPGSAPLLGRRSGRVGRGCR